MSTQTVFISGYGDTAVICHIIFFSLVLQNKIEFEIFPNSLVFASGYISTQAAMLLLIIIQYK